MKYFHLVCILLVLSDDCNGWDTTQFELKLFDLTYWKVLDSASNKRTLATCSAACSSIQFCNAFIYDSATQFCEMGRKYNLRPLTPQSNSTGWIYVAKSSPLILIGGGWTGYRRVEVELFDWKTGKSCNGVPLPIAKTAPVGTFMNGRPLICGGEMYTGFNTDCNKFQDGAWIQVSSNPLITKFASSVMVPDKGYLIYGGNGNFRSQQLLSIDGVWSVGVPYLYHNVNTDRMCVVQISDTVTGFFGGSANPYDIVLYFWNNQTYFKPPVSLIRPRYGSGCALLQRIGQSPVVASAGGENPNSRGIEIYDPATHKVKLIVDAMPSEIKYSSNYYRFVMVSVNDNTELIFLAGMTSGVYEPGIMKYSYELNEFEYIGQVLYPRMEATGFLVEDVHCLS